MYHFHVDCWPTNGWFQFGIKLFEGCNCALCQREGGRRTLGLDRVVKEVIVKGFSNPSGISGKLVNNLIRGSGLASVAYYSQDVILLEIFPHTQVSDRLRRWG